MPRSVFIYSPVGGHWGGFYLLPTVYGAAENMAVPLIYKLKYSGIPHRASMCTLASGSTNAHTGLDGNWS